MMRSVTPLLAPCAARVSKGVAVKAVPICELRPSNHAFERAGNAIRLDGLSVPVGEYRPVEVVPFFVPMVEYVERWSGHRYSSLCRGRCAEVVPDADGDLSLFKIDVLPAEVQKFSTG